MRSQVERIGRNNQETQRGVIPNEEKAEALSSSQFLAAKKTQAESRGGFFRRRRNSRRSKSLGKVSFCSFFMRNRTTYLC